MIKNYLKSHAMVLAHEPPPVEEQQPTDVRLKERL
jgi:hypothetical protein